MGNRLRALLDGSALRFVLVGVVNTLVGSAVMFGLYNLAHCSYWLSSAANYVVGSVLSYFLNKYFTFRNTERSWAQVGRFAVNIVVCYAVAYGLAKPAVNGLLSGAAEAVRDNVAMLTGMVLFTALNYVGQRFFAFRSKQDGNQA